MTVEPTEGWDDGYRTYLQHWFRNMRPICGSRVMSVSGHYHVSPVSHAPTCRKCEAVLRSEAANG